MQQELPTIPLDSEAPWQFPLFEAMRQRRSRRFGMGMRLNGGPLAYTSRFAPAPLALNEQAALVFAGAGVTGYALAELPYQGDQPESGGGQMMVSFIGRTTSSADALHSVALVVIDDDGAHLVRRPSDVPKTEIPGLIRLAQAGRLSEHYQRLRIRLTEHRPDIPRRNPFNVAFNQWSANVPGSTYFLPVNDLTPLYINILLTALSEDFRYYILDERAGYRPAGLGPFARSRGGHLEDDARSGRVATIQHIESWVVEFIALEQGMMLQNLALAAEAIGLGGFTHFAGHPIAWFEALGFQMQEVPMSRALAMGALARAALRLGSKDLPTAFPIGLERNGETLLRPLGPPAFPSMTEAVRALVDLKYASGSGAFRDASDATAWRDVRALQAGIPDFSDQTIAAVIAYCNYVHGRYGRFPAYYAPFRTLLAHQVHHLDPEFYDRFYKPGVCAETHHRHWETWHKGSPPVPRAEARLE